MALTANEGRIRNDPQINAAITNAKAFLKVAKKHGSFDRFIWLYVDNTPIVGYWKSIENVPATTLTSNQISKGHEKNRLKILGVQQLFTRLYKPQAW